MRRKAYEAIHPAFNSGYLFPTKGEAIGFALTQSFLSGLPGYDETETN